MSVCETVTKSERGLYPVQLRSPKSSPRPVPETKSLAPLLDKKRCKACQSLQLPHGLKANKDLCERCKTDLALQTCKTCQVICFPWQFSRSHEECDACHQAGQDPTHEGRLIVLGPFPVSSRGWCESKQCLCAYHAKQRMVLYCSTHFGVRPWLNVSPWLVVRVDEHGVVHTSRLE